MSKKHINGVVVHLGYINGCVCRNSLDMSRYAWYIIVRVAVIYEFPLLKQNWTAGTSSNNSCKSGRDWSDFQWEWAGLVKISAGMGEGSVTLLDEEHRIGQNSSRCGIKNSPTHICSSASRLSLFKLSTGIPGELCFIPNVTHVWDEKHDLTHLFTPSPHKAQSKQSSSINLFVQQVLY